jgi:DNA end-binding protein Ku
VVRPVPGGLMLHTLFWQDEIRDAQFQRLPEINDAELSIACQFIDRMTGKFDASGYEDVTRAKLLDVIQRKQAGETISVESVPKKQPASVDLTASLLASIAAAKNSRAVAGGVQ